MKSAIERKLKSKITLNEKCKLAKNIFLASVKAVHIPQKEEYILHWLVSLLLKKFSPSSQSFDEGCELWELLLRLSESPKFDAAFVAACKDRIWDLLHCIVDYSSTLNSIGAPKKWMIVSLKGSKHLKAVMSQNQDELNLFTSKCVKHDFAIDDILAFHLSTCQHKSKLGNNFHDELLPALLTAKEKHPKVLKLINLCVFKNHYKQWELFLKTSLENQDDCKPKSDDFLGSLMNKISSMSLTDQIQAVDMLYAAALYSTAMGNHGMAQLFCVCCDIIQLSPASEDSLKIAPLASTVFLPKVKADLKTRLICLKSLISTSIEHKLDVNTAIVRETPWLKYLQHLVKSLSSGQEALEEEAIDIILMLAHYSPSVIEPAVGSIAMGIMTSLNLSKKAECMDQLLFLFQRLRQLPKLIARLLIAISKGDKTLSWTPEILKSFAANVIKLPTGQLLELWKTFDYHLKNNNPFNLNTIDSLMSTFLLHSRLVEQSIPDITIDKVSASIKNTASLAEGLKVPLICTALAEMSLALTNIGHGSNPVKMVTWLQKRKMSTIVATTKDSPGPIKKSKIDWDDIASLPIGVIKVHLEDVSTENLKENLERIIESLDEESIEENGRIHSIIMESVLNKLRSRGKGGKSKFLTALVSGAMDEVATVFECLQVKDEKDLEMLQKLPLEHLHGDLEAKMSLLSLSVIKSSSSILFARCLNSTFRPCSILKYLPVWQVLETLQTCPSTNHQDQILQSVLKLSVTYQKPFVEIKQRKEELVKALENKSDLYWLKVSIFLMETLLPSISLSNEEKKSECKLLFKSLAKAYLAGEAKDTVASQEDETLTIKALSSVLKQADISPDELSAKKWKELTTLVAKKLGYYAENWKFLETILNCYTHLDNPRDILNSIAASKIHLKHLESEEDAKVLRLYFQVTAANAEESLQTMFDELLEATMTDSAYWNNWKYLAESKMPTEETHAKRRDALEKVLSTMLVVSPLVHPAPMLEMYRSLLDLDKPVVYKEAESLCVSHVAQIDLHSILVNDQLANFCQHWEAVYKILSAAFHKRPSAVVVARIPIVLRGMRNLLESLTMAANQKQNLQPTDIKKLVTLAHYFDRLCEHIRMLKEEFGRVVPYFIGDVMNCFQKNTIYPHVRSNILRGIHKLLDSIDNHSVEYLSTILPPGQQEMFKHIYSNYKHYHSYKGKV